MRQRLAFQTVREEEIYLKGGYGQGVNVARIRIATTIVVRVE